MNRDRLVQLVAVLIAAGALVGSALLVPAVNAQRRDLQLSFDAEVGDQIKPTYAVLAAGLGSFRGLAVNALWYRAEMEKRAGRFAEANNIAQWITELQPRFPQVWAFHAWNMAYNISVATFTPQERWDWINKAVHLLREEGIRYNPRAVQLYRELAWTFFHKVGQYADDMNWYYKAEVAREWHEVLGGAADYLTDEQLKGQMGLIAAVGDRYLLFERPSRLVREELDKLAVDIEPIAERLDELHDLGVVRLVPKLEKVQNDLSRAGRVESAERVGELLTELRDTLQRAERDPVAVFREEYPTAGLAIDAVRGAGFDLDARALRAIGKLRLYSRYGDPDWVVALPDPLMDDDARRMAEVFRANGTMEFRRSLDTLLPFLRAKVLRDDYNMDPAFMHAMMLKHGPLDWRHIMSHSLYWAEKGLDVASRLRNDEGVDYTNTKRIVIHSIQSLTDFGSLRYNPLLPAGAQVDQMPNPAFIDAYRAILKEVEQQIEDGEFPEGARRNFDSGYENFLHKAIYLNYFFGDEAKARAYYRELRDEFGDKAHNQFERRYEQTMEDLIWEFLREDLESQGMARAYFDASLNRAFTNLAYGRLNQFNRAMSRMKQVYDRYQEQRSYETSYDVRNRLALPPFEQMVLDAFTHFMSSPALGVAARREAFVNAPPGLVRETYLSWIENVKRQLQQNGDPTPAESLFPPPQDLPNVDQPQDGQIDGGAMERN